MVEQWSAPKTSDEQKKALWKAMQRDRSISSKQLTEQLELFMIPYYTEQGISERLVGYKGSSVTVV